MRGRGRPLGSGVFEVALKFRTDASRVVYAVPALVTPCARKAHELTGFAAADFSRIRNADHGRFTLDRMIRMLHALDAEVEVRIAFERRAIATRPDDHLERT